MQNHDHLEILRHRNQLKLAKLSIKKKISTPLNINIITNNINGLQMTRNPHRLDQIVQKMYSENIDILLLQEINTNTDHPKVKQVLQQTKKRYPQVQFIWSHIVNMTNQIYQPGGTGLIALPTISKHITQRHVDEMGR
jgi:endonuclease/exonuclease/phosphatase family metal-dependent hydrolase